MVKYLSILYFNMVNIFQVLNLYNKNFKTTCTFKITFRGGLVLMRFTLLKDTFNAMF